MPLNGRNDAVKACFFAIFGRLLFELSKTEVVDDIQFDSGLPGCTFLLHHKNDETQFKAKVYPDPCGDPFVEPSMNLFRFCYGDRVFLVKDSDEAFRAFRIASA